MGSAEAIAKKFKDVPSVQVFTAAFKGVTSDGKGIVDAGAGRIPVVNTGQYFPLIDDTVRVLRLNDTTILLGIAVPKSPTGTVEAVNTASDGSIVLDVRGDDDSILYPRLRVFDSVAAPTIGDHVSVNWPIGGVVDGRYLLAAPAAPVAPVDGQPTRGSAEFRAVESGSYRDGRWWQNDVWYSDTNTGAWFYGTQIRDTILPAATITRIQIYLPRFYAVGGDSTFGTHTRSTKPSGNVTVSNGFDTGGTGWVDAPLSWADALAGGGGVGTGSTGHGWNKYKGTNSDALSGALRIDWTTA